MPAHGLPGLAEQSGDRIEAVWAFCFGVGQGSERGEMFALSDELIYNRAGCL